MTSRSGLRLTLLGHFSAEWLEAEGARYRLSLPKGPVTYLLAYLALHAPAAMPRSRLAGLLNPDQPENQARRALSDALYRLRRELGEAWIDADADAVRLETDGVWIDLHEFTRQASSPELKDWQCAVELYAGDLLEDFDVDWALGRRAGLREQYLTLLERMCTTLTQAHQLPEALAYAHRWTLADPLNEAAHRAAMRLFARLGRHAAALQQYARLAHVLADELDAEPLPETRALAQSLRAEYEALSEERETRHVLVGRRRERAALLEFIEQTQAGRGGLVLVEGEAGIGKTRLLESLVEGAAWRGLTVAWGRARALSGEAIYAPVLEAMQSALRAPRVEQLRTRLAPQTLVALARLLPRMPIGANAAMETWRAPDAQPVDLAAVFADVFSALAELAPHLLICDDVQWADEGFWDVMRQLAAQVSERPLLIVLSYRGEELRANAGAWLALQALDRDLAPARIMLSGLSLSECAELARAWQPAIDEEMARGLHQRTRGNPLFVRELMAQPEKESSLQTLLAQRLGALNLDARAALEAGAVLGREFTHGTWQSLVGAQLVAEIPALTRTRFIEESEHGYRFQHDLMREHVYRSLAPARRREWHRRAGEVLVRERAEPSTLAWHFEQAERWAEAVRYQREAGERAANAYAHSAALDHFARALALLTHVPESQAERLTILRRRQRVWGILLRVAEWRADVDEIERAATELGDVVALLEALEARVDLFALAADFQAMQATASRALALASASGQHAAEARIARTLGRHLVNTLTLATEAEPYIQRAIQLAEAIPDPALLASALCTLSYIQRVTGRCAAARESAARALALSELYAELHPFRADALHVLASATWSLGEWEAAYETLRTTVQMQRELNNRWALEEACNSFATLASWIGQHAEAREAMDMILSHAAHNRALESEATSAYLHVLAGELEAAERALSPLQAWIDSAQDSRGISTALIAQGWLRLAQKRPTDAVPPLERAVRIWRSSPNVGVTPLLLHAIAAARSGNRAAARESLAPAEQMLQHSDVARYAVLLHLARFEVSQQADDLQAARREIQRQAGAFQAARLRADFLNHVQLHHEIEALWQALHPAPLGVRLARADAPLGKSLADEHYADVRWTIDDGAGDAAILRDEGKVALRRHRLQRLLDEARAQGAAPTDADLAHALGVTVRTVERDMAYLRSIGQRARTRRRR